MATLKGIDALRAIEQGRAVGGNEMAQMLINARNTEIASQPQPGFLQNLAQTLTRPVRDIIGGADYLRQVGQGLLSGQNINELAKSESDISAFMLSDEELNRLKTDPTAGFKNAASILSYAIPAGGAFGGGMSGAVKAGAAGGALGGFGASEATNLTGMLRDTLLGTATGAGTGAALYGAGQGIGRLRQGAKSRSALNTLKKYNLDDVGDLAESNIAGGQTGQINKANEIINTFDNPQSPFNQLDDVAKADVYKSLIDLDPNLEGAIRTHSKLVSGLDNIDNLAQQANQKTGGNRFTDLADSTKKNQYRRMFGNKTPNTKKYGGMELFDKAEEMNLLSMSDDANSVLNKTYNKLDELDGIIPNKIAEIADEGTTVNISPLRKEFNNKIRDAATTPTQRNYYAKAVDQLNDMSARIGSDDVPLDILYRNKQNIGNDIFESGQQGLTNQKSILNEIYQFQNDKIDDALKAGGFNDFRKINNEYTTALNMKSFVEDAAKRDIGKPIVSPLEMIAGGALGGATGNPLGMFAPWLARRTLTSPKAYETYVNSLYKLGNMNIPNLPTQALTNIPNVPVQQIAPSVTSQGAVNQLNNYYQ